MARCVAVLISIFSSSYDFSDEAPFSFSSVFNEGITVSDQKSDEDTLSRMYNATEHKNWCIYKLRLFGVFGVWFWIKDETLRFSQLLDRL
jgi:hypothetical protein